MVSQQTLRKGKERKGKERKGKEREGKGREGKERKGKAAPVAVNLTRSQALYPRLPSSE